MRKPVLTILWILLVLWYELFVFFFCALRCSWPLPSNNSPQRIQYKHVLVIADPQILGPHSYPDRPLWLRALSQFIVDLNLRKNWRAARRLNPDVTIVLGDMMDGGRDIMSDEDYDSYFNRFCSIFRFSSPKDVHYVPGNHDVGLGKSLPISTQARDRFYAHFGPSNKILHVTNDYSLVILDSPRLLDEDEERIGSGLSLDQWSNFGGAADFITSVSASQNLENPNFILFTHIPLYRPLSAQCGPLREQGLIRPGGGAGYQNMLSSELSQFVLSNINPVLVLSGDDHDYCEYTHLNTVREVTVKSISMAMGIRSPGFQLISIPIDSRLGHADRPCLLPDQLGIYLTIYLPCVAITILILLFRSSSPEDRYYILPPLAENQGYKRNKSAFMTAATLVCAPIARRRCKGSRLRRLVNDFGDVARLPVSVFLLVTLYMFLT